MRLVVQRVTRARVTVDRMVVGDIGRGAVVLVGVGAGDSDATADAMADRLAVLRYFPDDVGRTNLALAEADGAYLVVSQFTLYADVRRGRRPGFTDAAPPELAERLVERFATRLRKA
ncbi:MAG TPA: D-aminoacyl-tRNA deacylase, partial [Candidatus Limnocylindria bacterium]|nr:D-aminoacyl-tRNA deacylase [Candidatus Limnocylindria bacterium]